MELINELHILDHREINVRREDLAFHAAHPESDVPTHGKMSAINELVTMWYRDGVRKISCYASHGSNWALGLARLCDSVNVATRVYMIGKQKPAWTDALKNVALTELITLRPNHIGIVSAQARKLSEADGFAFIPFGFETPYAMRLLTERLSFDDNITLVMCAGSGITLACALMRMKNDQRNARIYAVSTGRSKAKIIKTVARYVEPPQSLTVIEAVGKYGASNTESIWPTHPFYERKAYVWLAEHLHELDDPVWFLNM